MKDSNFEYIVDKLCATESKASLALNNEKNAAEEVQRLRAIRKQLEDKFMVIDHHSNKMKEALDGLYVALCDVVENVKSDAPEMWQRADDALTKAKVFRDHP